MLHKRFSLCLLLAVVGLPVSLFAQNGYSDQAQVARRLQAIVSANAQSAQLQTLTKTDGGSDIFMLRLGTGDFENKPAIAVVGGVEGFHLLGTELALRFAENLMRSHKDVLEKTTFYILPSVSPDASAQAFARLKYERRANARTTDMDRDGTPNEDGFEDLNNDGMITMMRVEDPTGTLAAHPADPRVLVAAKTEKGEKGIYKVFTEGRDNDKDGAFNEDSEGGIFFNKNWSFKFPAFKPGAGEFAVSEKETRAVADFLYERWNVFAVVSFGSANNLSTPLRFNRQNTTQRVITGILEDDAKVNAMVSDMYNENVKQKNAPTNTGSDGDFFSWAYFHYGKYSFSTPGWWAPAIADDKDNPDQKPNSDKNNEVNFLRWAEQNNVDAFVEWTSVEHPDFPGKRVEVGGFKPFVMYNPPIEMVDEIAESHTGFIVALGSLAPGLALVNEKVEALGNNVYRVSLDVKNTSVLPTHSQLGRRAGWLKRIRVDAALARGQKLMIGNPVQLINVIEGDSHETLTWMIQGKGSVSVKIGAPHTGFVTKTINLN